MRMPFFRARRKGREEGYTYRSKYKNGDWIYGLITKRYPEEYWDRLNDEMTDIYGVSGIEIDRDTIEEFTGRYDNKGKMIFEKPDICINVPCYIGQKVWVIPRHNGKPYGEHICEDKVQMIGITSRGVYVKLKDYNSFNKLFRLGKSVFLTKEEAEEQLRREENELLL